MRNQKITCSQCGVRYPLRSVHSVLGVLVCKHCYPDVRKYCDCCSDRKRLKKKGRRECIEKKEVNRKLF